LFLPPGVLLLLRMLGELEGTAKQLNPQFGLFELIADLIEWNRNCGWTARGRQARRR
jgi:hypothetical protein